MNKISTIAMCAIFAFGMPLMASVQRSNIEHRPKKEMREKHRPRAMHDKDFKMMCEIVEDASFSKKKIGVARWLVYPVTSKTSNASNFFL